MKKHLVIFALFTVFYNSSSFSQTDELSIDIIRKGVGLFDEKKYDESIAELRKVHRNDSNYYLASTEILLSYLQLGKNNEGLELCNHLLKLKNDYTPNILIYKGDFLDNLNKQNEALEIYSKGLKDYPTNHSFLYEAGVLKLKKGKYEEAYDYFTKTLKLNPFHSASHFQLALMAIRQNNIVGAMMAYQFYLLSDVGSARAKSVVVNLEKLTKLELQPDTIIEVKNFGNDFSELESIIKSKIAFTDKYKCKIDLKYEMVKQMQLLIENIGKYSDVTGFYNDFYGKFFTELQKQKMFEPFTYYCLSGMEIESINKWMTKNKSEVDKYENWAYNYICEKMATYNENLNGQVKAVPHWFRGSKIFAAGERNANQANHGYWVYYYNNGIVKAEGKFDDGKKTGPWKYYFKSGGISDLKEFVNDNIVRGKSFYSNNNPKQDLTYKNGNLDGEIKTFYTNGNQQMMRVYKEGKIEGKESQFFRNSNLRYTLENKNESLIGDFVEYYDNGKIYQKFSFTNGNIEGPVKLYHNNQKNTVESEGVYVKGKISGEWKYYFKDGKIQKKGAFNSDGKKDGPWVEFSRDGKPLSEETFNDGKLSGPQKYYDYDGNLWQEYLYKKGKLLEYRAYKKDGSKVCDNKLGAKNISLVLYHANGQKRREGKISDGDMDGTWKDYNYYGALVKEVTYKDGNYNGPIREFFSNGELQSERTFVNGVEDGENKYYHINKKVKSEGKVVKGNYEGYRRHYYIDGSLEKIDYYTTGERDGWNETYDVNGKLYEEDLYSDGCLIKVVYHDTTGKVLQNIDLPGGNGTLKKMTMFNTLSFNRQFVNDYAVNKSTTYFPDGKTETEVTFNNGRREGKLMAYDEMGNVSSETNYFHDQLEGKRIFYFPDGKIESEYVYEDGSSNGKSVVYHYNGKLAKEINYIDDELQGESIVYDEMGEMVYKRFFFNDLLINYTYKGADGNFIKPMELVSGQCKIQCKFKNGNKSIEANYFNGDLNGKRLVYTSNNTLSTENDFIFNAENGTSKEYYLNGKVRLLENYYYGKLHGLTQSFYENGKVRFERMFKLGEKHGWTKFYDDKGTLLKSILYYNDYSILIK
jgi:antitoxin component YwqK of YwqJK toxin-antitoxin module/Tfp pilus assembly protein PilF